MSESRTPEEFPLVTTLLRESIQDLHQDIRELRQESRQHTQDLQNLSLKMDARFSRLTTTLIATTGIIVAAMGAMATVLKG